VLCVYGTNEEEKKGWVPSPSVLRNRIFLPHLADLEVVEYDIKPHEQGPRSNTPKDPFNT